MGRPPSRPGLGTTSRREICWWLAQGCSKEDAAKRAGLPDTYRLHAFSRTSEFATELRDAMRDHLATNLAPRAVKTLQEIMDDKNVTPRVRVDAAKAILDRSGYTAAAEDKRPPAALTEMSIDQLNALIADLEAKARQEEDRRAEAATPIDVLD